MRQKHHDTSARRRTTSQVESASDRAKIDSRVRTRRSQVCLGLSNPESGNRPVLLSLLVFRVRRERRPERNSQSSLLAPHRRGFFVAATLRFTSEVPTHTACSPSKPRELFALPPLPATSSATPPSAPATVSSHPLRPPDATGSPRPWSEPPLRNQPLALRLASSALWRALPVSCYAPSRNSFTSLYTGSR